MHPQGGALVLCIAGAMTLHREFADGSTARLTVGPGAPIPPLP